MTDNTQPEALRLAKLLTADEWPGNMTLVSYARECVAELRRQHARITELEAQLSSSGFTAADTATAEARGFRDGVASVAASAPSAHIKEPYTLTEIKAKIASNDYSAELLLQHAMALLDGASLSANAGEPVAWMDDDGNIEHNHKPWMSDVWKPIPPPPTTSAGSGKGE